MNRSRCFKLAAAFGLSVGLLGAARAQELPVIVPNLPVMAIPPTIPVTFDAFHSATATQDGMGLHLDVGDPTLQGAFQLGIFPFAEGDADLAYTRFAFSGSVVDGKCDLNVSNFLSSTSTTNVNGWPDGRGLAPPTMTVTARLDLVRVNAGKVTLFGPVDGRFSFRMAGTAVQPSVTIVEGPLINLKESGDPSRVTISWKTDGTATAKVRIVPSDLPFRAGSASPQAAVAAGWEFTAGAAQHHKVGVTGLSPSTRYLYVVESQAPDGTLARSPLYAFTTAPCAGQGEVTFMAISDNPQAAGGGERASMGINREAVGQLAFAAVRHDADLVIFSGDLVFGFSSNADDFRFQLHAWKDAWSPFWNSRPVYAVPGNHEIVGNFYNDGSQTGLILDRWPYATESSEAVFSDELVMPANGPLPSDSRRPPYKGTAYSFQYGPVLFVGLNNFYWWTLDNQVPKYGGSPQGYLMDDQLRWFEGVMASAQRSPTVRFIVVFMHEPAFPSGPFTGMDGLWWDGNNNIRAYVLQGGKVLPAGEGVIDVRNRFWRTMAQNSKTAALVTAHQHGYSRLLIDDRTPVGVLPGDDTNQDGVLDRFSPNPAFRLPVWQIIAGNGGANFSAFGLDGMPWTPAVVSNQEGYCIFRTRGHALSLTAYSLSGQVIDHVDDLMAVKRHRQ
jgi:3',5'-cyclic AMP phosphodiesterase CpdA